MASRQYSGKKPQNLKKTLAFFLSYIGRHRLIFLAVAVMVAISAIANLAGTYMIRPIVNHLADGDIHSLLMGVLLAAGDFCHRSLFLPGDTHRLW